MWKRLLKIALVLICLVFILVVGYKSVEEENIDSSIIEEKEEEPDTQASESEIEEFVIENNPIVRVVISDSSFGSIFHERVLVTSDQRYELKSNKGELYATYPEGKVIDFSDFQMKDGESLIVSPTEKQRFSIDSLTRSQGVPFYRGKLQIYKEEQGFVIVNEIPMEEYLLTVVPSEMPSDYPADALAAQAVCARSYAYSFLMNPGYPQYDAHMDDSTSYQVYNNINETESTTLAVLSTTGNVLVKDGKPMQTYFFSTSCGMTSNENVWSLKNDFKEVNFGPISVVKQDEIIETMAGSDTMNLYYPENLCNEEVFKKFIQNDDFMALEAEEQWYRWNYDAGINAKNISLKLKEIYEEKPTSVMTLKNGKYVNLKPVPFENIKDIKVDKRLPGGVADELLIVTEQETYLIKSEYYIRKILAVSDGEVIRNDKTTVSGMKLLPSAYFIIELERNKKENVTGIHLTGGGYGHGVGMSQNGAKCAAQEGMNWKEILSYFYSNLEIKKAE